MTGDRRLIEERHEGDIANCPGKLNDLAKLAFRRLGILPQESRPSPLFVPEKHHHDRPYLPGSHDHDLLVIVVVLYSKGGITVLLDQVPRSRLRQRERPDGRGDVDRRLLLVA